jgi:hypothetical protein
MEDMLMADSKTSAAMRQESAAPSPAAQTEEPRGETHFSLVFKFIFWLILLPAGLLYLAKWLLQSNWLQP